MNLLALFLFGSRARGDQSITSDIDLLAVTNNDNPTVSGVSIASLFHYSPEWLEAKADEGDLFLWHLVSEARPIYDPEDYLGKLKKWFRFSSDYAEQISFASDIAWMIVSSGSDLPPKIANRWLAWSVRTISIAHVAGRQKPAFSATALAEALNYSDISALVAQKDEVIFPDAIRFVLEAFLRQFGAVRPNPSLQTLGDFEDYFLQSENEVGTSILTRENIVGFYAK